MEVPPKVIVSEYMTCSQHTAAINIPHGEGMVFVMRTAYIILQHSFSCTKHRDIE